MYYVSYFEGHSGKSSFLVKKTFGPFQRRTYTFIPLNSQSCIHCFIDIVGKGYLTHFIIQVQQATYVFKRSTPVSWFLLLPRLHWPWLTSWSWQTISPSKVWGIHFVNTGKHPVLDPVQRVLLTFDKSLLALCSVACKIPWSSAYPPLSWDTGSL